MQHEIDSRREQGFKPLHRNKLIDTFMVAAGLLQTSTDVVGLLLPIQLDIYNSATDKPVNCWRILLWAQPVTLFTQQPLQLHLHKGQAEVERYHAGPLDRQLGLALDTVGDANAWVKPIPRRAFHPQGFKDETFFFRGPLGLEFHRTMADRLPRLGHGF